MRKEYQVCSSHTFAADPHCLLGTYARLILFAAIIFYLVSNLNSNLFYSLQYVALQTALQVDEVEICLVEEQQARIFRSGGTLDPYKDKFRVLGEQETLAELKTDNFTCGHLVNSCSVYIWHIHK